LVVVASWVASSADLTVRDSSGCRELSTLGGDEALADHGQNLAALVNGGFAAVWTSTVIDEFGTSIAGRGRVQFFGADGSPLLSQPVDVVTSEPGVWAPAVVADPAGGVFTAFLVQGPEFVPGPGWVWHLVTQRFDGRARPLWGEAGVEVTSDDVFDAFVLADGIGGVFVCHGGVRCHRLDRDGARLWGEGGARVVSSGAVDFGPRAVMDGTGGLLVFWLRTVDANDNRSYDEPDSQSIVGQRLSPTGARLWGDEGVVVHTVHAPLRFGPIPGGFEVVEDGSGGAIVVFEQGRRLFSSDADSDVLAQRIDWAGNPRWEEPVRVDARDGAQWHDATVAAPDGGVVVVTSFAELPSRATLWISRLSGTGDLLWGGQGRRVAAFDMSVSDVGAYAVFDHGVYAVVWTSRSILEDDADVRLARFLPNGTRLMPARGSRVTSAPGCETARGIAASATEPTAMVAWNRGDCRENAARAPGFRVVSLEQPRRRRPGERRLPGGSRGSIGETLERGATQRCVLPSTVGR
jgi:hypothetical protein